MKRNTLILFAVLFILAIFAWAGWANWEYRRQAAERVLASAAKGELVADPAGGMPKYDSPFMGKPAPAFKLDDLSGKKVSLDSYKGKAVLINFWATWCGPCKIETPWLIDLRNKYAGQGFEVLGISTEGDDLKKDDKAGWSQGQGSHCQICRGRENVTVPRACRWRQPQRGVRRTRRDAHFVFCGPQGQCSRSADGAYFSERDRKQYQESAGELVSHHQTSFQLLASCAKSISGWELQEARGGMMSLSKKLIGAAAGVALGLCSMMTHGQIINSGTNRSVAKTDAVQYLFPEQVTVTAGKSDVR